MRVKCLAQELNAVTQAESEPELSCLKHVVLTTRLQCMINSSIYLQEVSSEGLFQYTSPEEIENRVREMAAKKNVKLYGTKLVGFTPEEAYQRAVNALSQENATAWKCSAEYRM